jgi:hypothetical protein
VGVLAVAAFQFGHHSYVLSTAEPVEVRDALAVVTVIIATPLAIVWAVIAARYARRSFEGQSVPTSVLVGAAGYACLMGIAFMALVSNHLGWSIMRDWLLRVPLFTVLGTVMLPLSAMMCLGNGVGELVFRLAFGIPTVGPLLLLIWWTARRAAAMRPPAASVPTTA